MPPVRIARNFSTGAALVAAVGLLVTLSACATTDSADPDCTPTPPGTASDSVKVTGDFGALPAVKFDPGIDAPTTERSVVITGDGDTVVEGDTVLVQFSILNGATSVTVNGTSYAEGDEAAFPLDRSLLPGLVKTLDCSTVGSRVVGVIPPADAFGEAGSSQLDIGATDNIVFVVDIVRVQPAETPAPSTPVLPKADGVDQPPAAGLPTVVLDDTGRPTVTIPDTAPPTDLKLAVLKKGDGAVVADGDDVTVHYEGLNWTTKEIFDESWARGASANFNTSGVIPGFTQALVGQSVGSQVIVVIPPALGYGEASSTNSNPLAGQTLIFVIDILGIG